VVGHRDKAKFVSIADWSEIRREINKLASLGGLTNLESAGCLVAEAEHRRKIPSNDVVSSHLWQKLAHAGHRFAWLPTRFLSVEKNIPAWEYHPDGNASLLGRETSQPAPLPDGSDVADIVSEQSLSTSLLPAFASMLQKSNGKVFAQTFMFGNDQTPPIAMVRAVSGKFVPLQTASQKEGSRRAGVLRIDDAINLIADVSINGCAYDHGCGAADGRLAAWRTLGNLSGCSGDAGFEDVFNTCQSTIWIQFETKRLSWFFDVVWDGCLCAFRPEYRFASILAWTDTD